MEIEGDHTLPRSVSSNYYLTECYPKGSSPGNNYHATDLPVEVISILPM